MLRTPDTGTLKGARILLMGVFALATFLLWNHTFLWPLKMLVVLMHETGHAVASWLLGGSVERITVAANESGQCLSTVPARFLSRVFVYSAGYLGSALASAGLLVLTYRLRARRPMLAIAAAWLGAMGAIYAGDAFTLFFCLGAALALGLAAKFLPSGAVEYLNLFLATFSALYVLIDLKDDLWRSAGREHSDAALLANITPLPAVVWAVLWSVFSLAVLAWAIRVAAGSSKRAAKFSSARWSGLR